MNTEPVKSAGRAPPPATDPPAVGGAAGPQTIIETAEALRWHLPQNLHDRLTEAIYAEAARLADRNVTRHGESARLVWERRVDRLLTGSWTGFPLMALIFAAVLWLTTEGANYPSSLIAAVLIDTVHPALRGLFAAAGTWPWLTGLLVDGVYLATAWVVSVMLPPMAIFFPLFTILEDLGYLPRVAFNLDHLFQRAGAHGKQALTMSMGLGCNAAGVIAARIIDSPRERLIAIITNNFSLCNGRWPTQILIATVFVGALAPAHLAGPVAAATVLGVALLGFALALASSWLLSRTVLRGEASSFSLELPPYRPPHILRTLYTSLIDRTLFVLWRAVVFAAPAGAAIWLSANVDVGGQSLAAWLIAALDPAAWWLGLTGVVLVAYIVAIPANEIVIPTVLMLTVATAAGSGLERLGQGAGVMFEAEGAAVREILVAGGWSTMTAVCLLLFSLCHNPCSTTIYTIYKETRSWRWTALATLFPLAVGVLVCAAVAGCWRLLAGR